MQHIEGKRTTEYIATCSPGGVDRMCLFIFSDREPKFLTVVDASAKVKWVHAKVFYVH